MSEHQKEKETLNQAVTLVMDLVRKHGDVEKASEALGITMGMAEVLVGTVSDLVLYELIPAVLAIPEPLEGGTVQVTSAGIESYLGEVNRVLLPLAHQALLVGAAINHSREKP